MREENVTTSFDLNKGAGMIVADGACVIVNVMMLTMTVGAIADVNMLL